MNTHRRLFRLAMAVRGLVQGIAGISMLLAGMIILQMYLLSTIIDHGFISSLPAKPSLLFALAAVIVIRGLLLWLRERLAQQKAVQIKSGMRHKLFRHILELGPLFTRSGKTGEQVALVTEGVEKLDDYFTRYIPSIIHIAILPPAIIIFSFFIDWLSALIMLLTAPLILFFMWLIGTHARSLTQKQWGELSRLSAHFLDALQGLKTLKIFGVNQREADHVASASDRLRLITMSVLKVAFLSGMVLELAASISIALVAVQVGIRLIEGLMTYQPALFILLLAPEFYLPFRMLGLHHHAGMEGAAAARKMFDMLDGETGYVPVMSGSSVMTRQLSLELVDVGFTYPGSDKPALMDVSCRLDPATFTAVAGHTGSGKTTLAYLLMGFLRPGSGQILVNGMSLNSTDMEEWRKLVAFVPQHPHFFNATVLDNLLMANPTANMQQVIRATRHAGAHDFIGQLPQGYDTPLSENASRLSGGERQRLAIARAFLKDAPLLIMDEPTSNLDPESEQTIALATEHLAKDRTTLIIAHRLSTVYRADEILVFDKGRIAEKGNHTSLLKNRGVYAGFLETLGMKEGGLP
jgi:ATP-binding cassette, subfamily C, bacterial CydD